MKTVRVPQSDDTVRCHIHTRTTNRPIDLAGLNRAYGTRHSPVILGGHTAQSEDHRYSYWASDPIETCECGAGDLRLFDKLNAYLGKYHYEPDPLPAWPEDMFCGGWIGYFSYDLGQHIESTPCTTRDDLNMPLIRLAFYDRCIVYDHHTDITWLIVNEMDNDPLSIEAKFTDLTDTLNTADTQDRRPNQWVDMEQIDASHIQCNMTREAYVDAVHRIKQYIRDGETYQINFSHRFSMPFNADPMDLFLWQNTFNAVPYSAYLSWPGFDIVCASPEMFLTITGDRIKTKPIKGTRPRLQDNAKNQRTNAKNYRDLVNCAKEQAELNMIIDLERNDVAKICIPGTRYVHQARTIESFPSVFHAVATVVGQLRPEVELSQVLRATFPGGSITGAPKIRSMEIIDEMEPTARGIYTGSIGFIGLNGNVCLNIAIRTIIIAGRTAFVQTGGGIVADSSAEAEYQETLTKARALLAGIVGVQNR
jgi:anthranilate/para-aminobenzoate synthase component I